ncbi:glutathione S-transferase family protein [Paracraurococcus lichenis]|uniref:Glutathione S-transferase family protein n=1 Tax=Paracraurococcus lichenis TaxID=3064888 RepID=A0ABT9EAU7_9PROT|nr:glutathione S-transferase family protein [Paracraurococcus sp. LOR1-02]MDO9713180.1 glutathione S-transferase family protein [Paracraurococcus sp. LOR1-02]
MTGEDERPVLFGAVYSVYTRIARLALEEKGVPYRLSEIDIFAPGGPPADYLTRHPFGRIPAFEHDGFRLYEAGAIARYVDEGFPGPPLQPADARARARMNQTISLLDAYAYRTLVWDIFVERIRAPAAGRAPDEAKVRAAVPKAEACLGALSAILGNDPWLAGATLSLADLHAVPMLILFRLAEPEGTSPWPRFPKLQRWFEAIARRPSVLATPSPIEGVCPAPDGLTPGA